MTAAANRRNRRAQARSRRRAGASWTPRAARQRRAEITTFTYSDPMFLTAVDGPSGRLCSEVATLNSGGLVDQFEYWPYGELVDDLPEGAPVFLWVGGLGYWFDTDDRRYVRHRMLRTDLGSWMQLDPLWPSAPAICYALDDPIGLFDYLGLQPWRQSCKCQELRYGPCTCVRPALMPSADQASSGCNQCIAEAKKRGRIQMEQWEQTNWDLPRIDGTLWNALSHCVDSCEGMRRCGLECAMGYFDFREWLGRARFWMDGRHGDMDQWNNEQGYGAPVCGKNCLDYCRDLANAGMLRWFIGSNPRWF